MRKHIFLFFLLLAGSYLYPQDTNLAPDTSHYALIEKVNRLRLLKSLAYSNSEILCAIQYPKAYVKELKARGFYNYKFYYCRFDETRYDCSNDDESLGWELSKSTKYGSDSYIVAVSNDVAYDGRIYRISGFGDNDIWELVNSNPYLESRMKYKKRFLREYSIEKINMERFYEIYKSKKKLYSKFR